MATNTNDRNLAEHMTTEILSRLPVKSLLRLKCVSKHWKTLIKNSNFITKHLHHHTNHARLLVQHYNSSIDKFVFALFPDETLASVRPLYNDLDDLQKPDDPPAVIGPFDGILGLWDWDRIALWNPATKEFRALSVPYPNLPSYFRAYCHYFGSGLDLLGNTYKVVWIRCYYNEKADCPYLPSVVAVYTLATDSWRIFEVDLPPRRCIDNSLGNTYINGVYYWLTSHNFHDYMILKFDLSTETFLEIAGPPSEEIPKSRWVELTLFNGSIVMTLFDPKEERKCFDVWVMKEEGLWTKQFTIGPLLEIERVVGIWKNGELFLETNSKELVLYNSTTQQMKELGPRGKSYLLKVFLYKESLVSVQAGNRCREGAHNSLDAVGIQDFFTFQPTVIGGYEGTEDES